MKKIVIITSILLIHHFCYAQLLDNKVNLSIGYGRGAFHGNKIIKEGSFISPSLYSNYNELMELSFKVLMKRNKHYSLGLGFNNLHASGWKNDKSQIYNGSRMEQNSISPIMQIHNKYSENGILRRIRVFLEIAPAIGFSGLNLANSIIEIQGNSGMVSQPMSRHDIFFGIQGNTGFELSVTRDAGFYVLYSYNQNWIKSKLYNDNNFSFSALGLGLVIRFKKDKRFYY
jgi:hypothetical protein